MDEGMVSYNNLNIHEKINAKTGWDIATAYEGTPAFGFRCYTRLAYLYHHGVNSKLVGKIYKCYR